MADSIADDGFAGHTAFFSRWRHMPATEALGNSRTLVRTSNINPAGLAAYREHFEDQSITEDDLFYHVYGLFHSKQYKETYAADLGKSAARVPMPASLADFRDFANAGRELAQLHLGYEQAEPYDCDVQVADGWDINGPGGLRVTKLAYRRKGGEPDKTQILYNAGITLTGIPMKAHEYLLGPRSALDWLLDRYEVKIGKATGIKNDPNDWANEIGDQRYILDLVRRVTTVSVRTVDIVKSLPELPL